MDELACNKTQFDFEHGATSCMAASMCCARLFLEKDLRREDILRVLNAGATLYGRWASADGENNGLQCWTDVVNTYPRFLQRAKVVYEGNGFFGATHRDENASTILFDDMLDACATPTARHRVAGVLTTNGASYMIGKDANYWYAFDPHGTSSTESTGATMRRSHDRATMADYVRNEVACGTASTQFSVVLFSMVDDAEPTALI